VPLITIDSDGYTNIREQPSVKSKIVGKVYKYQLFAYNYDCDEMYPEYDNWAYIYNDSVSGFIYKAKIIELNELSCIYKYNFRLLNNKDSVILIEKDSIKIKIIIQPFVPENHIEVEFYGWDYGDNKSQIYSKMETEIKEIKIIKNDSETFLPHNMIKNFCNVSGFEVRIGKTGELYILIKGGKDEGIYNVWLSVVDGKIVDELKEIYCW
jgi:hypothetical protein